jgi:hypothetical protein
MTLPAPALLGERMWVEAESSGAYSCYEDFVEDTVPYLRKEMELMLASVRIRIRLSEQHYAACALLSRQPGAARVDAV